ncbi:hypothetical protein TNCV_2660821 [Trichonephila clavipes]|nr:hypothetical protein TNCV_2660821 [Trichonephila clavipes]
MANTIRMPDDSFKKILQFSHWDLDAWKIKAQMDRLSGIRLWDYKRENLEKEGEHEVTLEESLREGIGPQEAVLPDMMT